MSPFGGLFGHDKRSARATGKYAGELPALPGQSPLWGQLPAAPPATQAPPQSDMDVSGLADNSLVRTPRIPQKRTGAFDDRQYRNTMLQMAAGFFGSQNFGDGMAHAAQAIAAGNERARTEALPEIGGPDDSFEIYTNPETGERTYKPIAAVQDYANERRRKQKDVADIHGRVLHAISQLPPEQRASAYSDVIANPDYYGVDPQRLPPQWNDTYGTVAGNMGMTVPQAVTAEHRTAAAGALKDYRAEISADRSRRTDIAERKAGATISQGAQRLELSRAAGGRAERSLALRAAKAPASDGYEYRTVNGKLQRRKIR